MHQRSLPTPSNGPGMPDGVVVGPEKHPGGDTLGDLRADPCAVTMNSQRER